MATGATLIAPFAFDGFQARAAQAAGFEAVYMTGFGTAASYGLPDIGLLGASEMTDNVRRLAAHIQVPLICDADTGYGNPLNVAATVRAYNTAGAAAMHIEDQIWPKRCGFMDGKEVIPIEQMSAKVRAAAETSAGEGPIIIARTDALAPLGWDAAEERARSYAEAGAELLFIDGIKTRDDLDELCRRLGDLPLVYNGMLEPTEALCQRPLKIVLHPGPMMALFANVHQNMAELAESGRVAAASQPAIFGQVLKTLDARGWLNQADTWADESTQA
ncbi:MAG: isocitrate lyase/PEP mutase family protein [Pseudomonadota bacterium]